MPELHLHHFETSQVSPNGGGRRPRFEVEEPGWQGRCAQHVIPVSLTRSPSDPSLIAQMPACGAGSTWSGGAPSLGCARRRGRPPGWEDRAGPGPPAAVSLGSCAPAATDQGSLSLPGPEAGNLELRGKEAVFMGISNLCTLSPPVCAWGVQTRLEVMGRGLGGLTIFAQFLPPCYK